MCTSVRSRGRRPLVRRSLLLLPLALLAAASPATAKTCNAPGAAWEHATPAEVGMDAAKLQVAMDDIQQRKTFAVRVFRHGCLVAEDSFASANRSQRFQSWSMAKSVVSMAFGRAMTLGLISPDDPVGSLLPEADAAHGKITLRDLLTQTSGLRWNGFRDYDILMPDRVGDALTLDPVHPPGTYFEYAQSPVALLAEAVARATGGDFQAFVQSQLFTPLGIPASAWDWGRDRQGHTQGFFDLHMVPDDWGRLGDLFRRGGVWNGRRLLSTRYVRAAVSPTPTNGGYGWLLWTNRGETWTAPTTDTRPTYHDRMVPGIPGDMYEFSGLFDQRVTVFPGQDIVFVRLGEPADNGVNLGGGGGWESDVYRKLLDSVTDQKVVYPSVKGGVPDRPDPDYGFGTSLGQPDQFLAPAKPVALPPGGPARARALQLSLARRRATSRGFVVLRATCPPRASQTCRGKASLTGARRRPYAIAPGKSSLLALRTKRRGVLTAGAVNIGGDAAGGTVTSVQVDVLKAKKRRR
jgi:CubicO group peptidase (beta-lactamase class C family)